MDSTGKRGRGRGRGTRARGRGRGRGKKAAVVVSSDEETCDQTVMDTNGVAAEEATDVPAAAATLAFGTDHSDDVVMGDLNKENDIDGEVSSSGATPTLSESVQTGGTPMPVEEQVRPVPAATVLPQTIDMEADISQLEAPTFTTISRGPPEPMLRLKWDHKVSLIGEKVLNPMIHCCDQCDKPILLYGRMIPCKHVFCLKCARTEPVKTCPRCNDKVVRVEQSGLGMVFMCTHGGSRYGNTGCRRTYLSQRDLQAHINHRHVTQLPPPPPSTLSQPANDIKAEPGIDSHKPVGNQRKLSESSASTTIQAPSTLLTTRPQAMRVPSSIGSIPPPGSASASAAQSNANSAGHSHSTLTAANLARINSANAPDCHQGKVALHQTLKKTPITQSLHQPPETVADASYYSSVLNSFGAGGNSGSGVGVAGSSATGGSGSNAINPNSAAAVGYTYDPSAASAVQQNNQQAQTAWQQNQYYR